LDGQAQKVTGNPGANNAARDPKEETVGKKVGGKKNTGGVFWFCAFVSRECGFLNKVVILVGGKGKERGKGGVIMA